MGIFSINKILDERDKAIEESDMKTIRIMELTKTKDYNKICRKNEQMQNMIDNIKKEIADNHDYYYFAESNKDIALGLEYALNIINDYIKGDE